MPCYDPRGKEDRDINWEDCSSYKQEIKHLNEIVNMFEASLCALITELEKREIFQEVLTDATLKGRIDLIGFWKNHRNQDELRLGNELQKFSEHERNIMRELLNLKT